MQTEAASKPVMRIELLSHGFTVTDFNDRGKVALLDFARGMAQFGLVKVGRNQFERKMLRVFAAATVGRTEFRFHRNQYQEFLYHLAGYGWSLKDLLVTYREMYEPVKCEHPLKDTRPPHDYQEMLSDYLCGPCDPKYSPAKVVTLQTGKGKTFTDLLAIHRMGVRAVLVIKGMYVDKWISDVESAYHYKKGDLMVCRGTKDMVAIQQLALDGELKAKFIIITSKTWYSYMKVYETQNGKYDLIYPIHPDQFYEKLGAGVRSIDEVHQDFHCNFRQDLYTHSPLTHSLSATLDSDDPVTNRFYEVVWPLAVRAPEVKYDKFIAMVALWYSLNEPTKVRTKGGTGQYSHAEYEKSLMRHKGVLRNYFEMITAVVDKEFVSVFEKGQSMLIQFSLKEMCTQYQTFLQARFPGVEVSRYIDEDNYDENFMKGDVIISTIGSSGTAVDRPNLRVTLMTVALSSKQGNIQVLGRTRKLKDFPGITPKFIFLAAREIPKHWQYTKEKFEKLDGKVLSSKEMETSFRV